MSNRGYWAASAILLLACCWSSIARAQACCAGGSAVTPGRLEPHEDALVGAQARTGIVFGSYDQNGHYVASPSGDSEYDLEQDLFGAVRVLRRGQVALLVPLVETLRATPLGGSHFGGGVGDVNLALRYDFLLAGESRYVPGLALLAGVTFPTGTPIESAGSDVGATGVGAFQGNLALALEQTFGPWLVNATGLVAERTPRFGETLGAQVTLLAAGAYTFKNDAAVAFALAFAFEGDATASGGRDIPSTSKRLTTATISGLWPVTDRWRVLGSLLLNPPASALGVNQLATGGLTLGVIHSWS
jgi:hypothetical protein